LLCAVSTLSLLALSCNAEAVIEFDQAVTPAVIFGSGNDNGSFTTDRRNGIELGLRAKQRFPAANVFSSNGDGSYSFAAENACDEGGFSFARCQTTPVWSFEWSVNTDFSGASGAVLADFVYELGMDGDPGPGTDFLIFDNIQPTLLTPLWDHATGDNGTPPSGGVVASTEAEYASYLPQSNLAQNSWNYEFFNNLGTSLASFDPAQPGNYIIYLQVRDPHSGRVLAKTQIQVLVGNARMYRPFRNQGGR